EVRGRLHAGRNGDPGWEFDQRGWDFVELGERRWGGRRSRERLGIVALALAVLRGALVAVALWRGTMVLALCAARGLALPGAGGSWVGSVPVPGVVSAASAFAPTSPGVSPSWQLTTSSAARFRMVKCRVLRTGETRSGGRAGEAAAPGRGSSSGSQSPRRRA